MRQFMNITVASLVVLLSAAATCHAAFVQPTSITASSTSINTATALISEATANGGPSYAPGSPSSGGASPYLSWYTATAGTISTPVTLTFDFASSPDTFTDLYLWDYYTHSPPTWTLTLYSGANATGSVLLTHNFTFVPTASPNSNLKIIDFPDTLGTVLSGRLETFMNSASGGVGLSEIAFITVLPPVPEPSTLALLGIGTIGLAIKARRRLAA